MYQKMKTIDLFKIICLQISVSTIIYYFLEKDIPNFKEFVSNYSEYYLTQN